MSREYARNRDFTFMLIAVASVMIGCAKEASTGPRRTLITNSVGMVSIGVLNTIDSAKWAAVRHFFASNGIGCVVEGTVSYDVMVLQQDVDRARALLQTNRPPEPAFQSVWVGRGKASQ